LTPESTLSGRCARDDTPADVAAVLTTIEDERLAAEERERRRAAADVA
jgi:hypothetical protein